MVKNVSDLLESYRKNKSVKEARLLRFPTEPGEAIYNPSTPFTLGGQCMIAGRSEKDFRSQIKFFSVEGEKLLPLNTKTELKLEDPFVTQIGDELFVGGVRLEYDSPEDEADFRYSAFITDFYRGKSLDSLRRFAVGPRNMKDIRFVSMPDGKIAVCTRPHGLEKKYGFTATIGFTVLDDIGEFNAEMIANAPIFTDLFAEKEWGGANQLFVLKNGLIGVLGHIACGEYDGDVYVRHYYSMAFAVDTVSRSHTQPKIICERADFPPTPARNAGLEDIVFTAGLERYQNGTARLYTGLSDAAAGCALIPDPFAEFEEQI